MVITPSLISDKSLFFMTVMLSVTCLYSSDTIIPELFKHLVFYDRNISIELGLLQWNSPIDPF